MKSLFTGKNPIWLNHGVWLNLVGLIGAICAACGVGFNANEKAVIVTLVMAVLNFLYHAIHHLKFNYVAGFDNIAKDARTATAAVERTSIKDKPQATSTQGAPNKPAAKAKSKQTKK